MRGYLPRVYSWCRKQTAKRLRIEFLLRFSNNSPCINISVLFGWSLDGYTFAFITAFGAKTQILNGCLKGATFVVFKCMVLSYLSNRPDRVDSRRGGDPAVKELSLVGKWFGSYTH